MQRNIILIGFMGTGKSTVGRQLSKTLDYPLIDTDHAIVEKDGRSISKIFAEDGEEAFRDLETKLLESLKKHTGYVIATGGGIIEREENRALLAKLGYVIWLVASPQDILERTSRNKERPLLAHSDPEKTIRERLTKREPLYQESADLEIMTTDLSLNEVVTGIIQSAHYHFSKQK